MATNVATPCTTNGECITEAIEGDQSFIILRLHAMLTPHPRHALPLGERAPSSKVQLIDRAVVSPHGVWDVATKRWMTLADNCTLRDRWNIVPGKTNTSLQRRPVVQKRLRGPAIFFGHSNGSPIFNHYGHFITEGCARLHGIASAPDLLGHKRTPVLIVGDDPKQNVKTANFFRALGSIFGLKVVFATEPTMCAPLIFAERAVCLQTAWHMVQGDTYRSIAHLAVSSSLQDDTIPAIAANPCIFAKRGKPTRMSGNDEMQIAKWFQERGFVILENGKLRILDQIRVWSKCTVAVGLSGTDMHNCAWMPRGGTVITFCKSPKASPPAQMFIEHVCGLNGFTFPNIRNAASFLNIADDVERLLAENVVGE
jgi:hypothetical protein